MGDTHAPGRPGPRRQMTRAIAAAGIAALLTLLAPPAATAHSFLRTSTPEDGEVLQTAPSEVVLEFTEPPELELHTQIRVLDPHGQEVDSGALEQGDRPEILSVEIPELHDGVYTVTWRALSRVDGHVTAGSFAFGIGADPLDVVAGAAHEDGHGTGYEHRPTFLSVAGRWAFFWGLTLLAGAALSGLFMFGRPIRWAGRLTAVGWVLAAAGLVAMFLSELGELDASAGALLASERGNVVIARAVPLLLAGVVAVRAISRTRRLWPWLLGSLVAAGMLVHSYAGHAGAPGTWQWAAVGAQWIHILAVGIWVGGLAWLIAGLVGEPLERSGPASRRFSALAGVALVGVAATGVIRAWQEIGSLGALFDTGFGLSAVGKTALFVGMVGLGAYNRYRMIPSSGATPPKPRTFRRTISGELLLAAGVFGLSGIMAGLAPPAQVAVAAAPANVVAEGTDFARTVDVRLTVTPGTPGLNRFDVRLERSQTREPMEADQVVLRFSLPDRPDVGSSELELEQEHHAPGNWTARGSNLSLAGTWRVGVRIQAGADSVEVALEVTTRVAEPRIDAIEGGAGEPTLYTIELPGGRSVQSHVEPGAAGHNEVHYTFFTEEGTELEIVDATGEAIPEDGASRTLEVRRLSPGHFVASVELEPGTWRFRLEATTDDGESLIAEYEEQIE
jgi:copper transport protein